MALKAAASAASLLARQQRAAVAQQFARAFAAEPAPAASADTGYVTQVRMAD
jgi:hypothetical protein